MCAAWFVLMHSEYREGMTFVNCVLALWNPDTRVYFDFVDCGNKYSRQLDHIMTLLRIIIPKPDDIWMMLPQHNS